MQNLQDVKAMASDITGFFEECLMIAVTVDDSGTNAVMNNGVLLS